MHPSIPRQAATSKVGWAEAAGGVSVEAYPVVVPLCIWQVLQQNGCHWGINAFSRHRLPVTRRGTPAVRQQANGV